MAEYPLVERRPGLSGAEFLSEYVANGRPVIIEGAMSACRALRTWTPRRLKELAGQHTVRLKDGYVASLRTTEMRLADYVDLIESERTGPEPAPYLHDLPLLSMLPELRHDLEPFPRHLFSPMYRAKWWEFTQFFLGPKASLTPLHFDCLETQNLFFQVYGEKRWILIDRDEARHCYVRDWRWSEVDAEAPDLEKFPDYRHVRPLECTLGPGDILYVPPGTLHHVRSRGVSISFNIDWHTRMSALRGVLAFRRGMPLTNVRYNLAAAVGLWARLPSDVIMPFYRSYLSYIS
ncbi:MAG TPA: cupin-like domain-containing protein [Kofleriaceae bacterium]|nr:cupin-like domain-containing protein [Kofleriaceae bacterium]